MSAEVEPPRPVLPTVDVGLRRLEPVDAPLLWRWWNDPELAVLADRWRGPISFEQVEASLRGHYRSPAGPLSGQQVYPAAAGSSLRLGVTDEIGRLIGEARFAVAEEDGLAWLGLVIGDPSNRGRGYGTAAAWRMLAWTFDALGCYKAQAKVYAFNRPSFRCLERVGMQIEGRLRQSHHDLSRRHDEWIFGMTRDEFARLRSRAKRRSGGQPPGWSV